MKETFGRKKAVQLPLSFSERVENIIRMPRNIECSGI
jgi:hypothetical protein